MDSDALARLEANLKELAQVDLPLARRIIAPVDDSVLDTSDPDAPAYTYHHNRTRSSVMPPRVGRSSSR